MNTNNTTLIPKTIFTLEEVHILVKQAWWAGFNRSAEGNNGEHCQTSIEDLKIKCNIDSLELLEGSLKNQIPE